MSEAKDSDTSAAKQHPQVELIQSQVLAAMPNFDKCQRCNKSMLPTPVPLCASCYVATSQEQRVELPTIPESCGNCRFWSLDENGMEDSNPSGFCRRHPPNQHLIHLLLCLG